ncbi:hypothetical protein L9F63_005729 [Diploptera punctata]|uniref:Uncharacterized protein n=1 Tax=Diploptera punctata TaxID=6984 RepID=A0AAD8E5M8_DIPPU|nr:hypothetical protein L9F63_005729 [Diploptera punctata]
MENNNKESFKLLGMSASGSDSASDVPEVVLTPPRKRKIRRRLRGTRSRQPQQTCMCHGRIVAMSIGIAVLVCWLVTITWLAIVLHSELKRLDTNVQNVVAGSQAVPEALQKCHSLTRDLQKNQTLLFSNFAMLSHQLQNFSSQLKGMLAGLQSVEDRLKAAPELVNLPQDVQSLSTSVASFGSQIRDMNTTVTGLKNDNNQLQELANSLTDNVTSLKQKVAQLTNLTQQLETPWRDNSAEKEAVSPVILQLTTNLTLINDTLNNRLQWINNDQIKDHKELVHLQDSSLNMSARLTTLEGECVKLSLHSLLNKTVDKLAAQVSTSSGRLNEVATRLDSLQQHAQKLEDNTTQLAAQINFLLHPQGIEELSSPSVPPNTDEQ